MKLNWMLLLPTIAFAQPMSIHYSAQGNYLVDQDGNRTTIQGYPQMICHQERDIDGTFFKADGAIIWLRVSPAFFLEGDDIVKIEKPVCDLKEDK
jgi:hypothetical protein